MLRLASHVGLLAAALSTCALVPKTAHACGGCFAPVGQPSVVTAHRMVVSINDSETTLWDQFEYAGNPEDFVWVLPVSGGADVQIDVAQQSFFQYLNGATAVTLYGPVTGSGGGGFSLGCGASAAAAGASDSRVTVYSSEVVGPYETVVIGSDDAMSLTGWLTDNGYAIPESLTPTIAHYVDEGMSFAVLRLSPDAGVSQMQPVRVTVPGAQVSFPLRMVAAGIGETVSLELFLIAEGRWEVQNFPNAEIADEDLTYDAASGTFDYDAVASELLGQEGGRTWLTEVSQTVAAPYVTAGDPTSPQEDWLVATRGLSSSSQATVTRMRAELPANALSEDLILQASEQPPRFATYYVTAQTEGAVIGNGDGGDGTPALLLLACALAWIAWPRRRIARV